MLISPTTLSNKESGTVTLNGHGNSLYLTSNDATLNLNGSTDAETVKNTGLVNVADDFNVATYNQNTSDTAKTAVTADGVLNATTIISVTSGVIENAGVVTSVTKLNVKKKEKIENTGTFTMVGLIM